MGTDPFESDKIRTAMANERTFLAYLRTALSFLVFGLAIIKFFPESAFLLYTGVVSLAAGVVMFLWGVRSYLIRK